MKIIRTIQEMQSIRHDSRGFVPTMGALHEGHCALIRRAKHDCGEVVLSIFVNPLQFGPNEDFNRYPRPESLDLERAESAGADIAFLPTVEAMYPDSRTIVQVAGLRDIYEGSIRPGHFDGVATVVAKLFHIVQPKVAYFGMKDLQQCAVIQRMVVDLCMPVTLEFVETVRDEDGLALSSRNQYLSIENRALAPRFAQVLRMLAQELADLGPESTLHSNVLGKAATALIEYGFQVDYIAAVDPDTYDPWSSRASSGRVIGAVRLGTTRLIDNVPITN